jgi:hypothetical protein
LTFANLCRSDEPMINKCKVTNQSLINAKSMHTHARTYVYAHTYITHTHTHTHTHIRIYILTFANLCRSDEHATPLTIFF